MGDSERTAAFGIGKSHAYRILDDDGAIVTHQFKDLEAQRTTRR